MQYLSKLYTYFDEICFADAHWPFGHYRAKTFKLQKYKTEDYLHFENRGRAIYLQSIDRFCQNLA